MGKALGSANSGWRKRCPFARVSRLRLRQKWIVHTTESIGRNNPSRCRLAAFLARRLSGLVVNFVEKSINWTKSS
jgi:hypothetical protein